MSEESLGRWAVGALCTGTGREVSGKVERGELKSTGVGDFSQVLGLPLPLPLLQEAVFLADSR